MNQATYTRLLRINLAAELGHAGSGVHATASAVAVETSTLRMALLCSARQFGHQLTEWMYDSDGRVTANCVHCQGEASLLYRGPGAVRVEHDIPFTCSSVLSA